MSGIVEQLLDVVRTQLGGGIPIAPATMELGTVVMAVLDELAIAYPAATFEPMLHPVYGSWDPDRLAQVVTNLVGNAIQHGAKGSPIWIETRRDGSDAVLKVRNVSTTPIRRIRSAGLFSPFRRAGPARGGRAGLGLGLYIASEILRAHHGEISVESFRNTITFVVRLPLESGVSANVATA